MDGVPGSWRLLQSRAGVTPQHPAVSERSWFKKGTGSPRCCHPPSLYPSSLAIPGLLVGWVLPGVLGTHPWDEGRLLQPVWELPRAHRGSLLPWCSAELLKRLGSELVVKQEKKPKHFIIHQTATASFYGGHSLRRSGWQSRDISPGLGRPQAPGTPSPASPAPIHPPTPDWHWGQHGHGQGRVTVAVGFYQLHYCWGCQQFAVGRGCGGPCLMDAASCSTLRSVCRARQCVSSSRGEGRERAPGLVPIAFPGKGSWGTVQHPFPRGSQVLGMWHCHRMQMPSWGAGAAAGPALHRACSP